MMIIKKTVQKIGCGTEFRQRYNDHWLLERLSFQSPRQARREAACP
jgi:hypothetical protein